MTTHDDLKVIDILSRRYPDETFRACPGRPNYYISDHGSAWTTWPYTPYCQATESLTHDGVFLRRLKVSRSGSYSTVTIRNIQPRRAYEVYRLVLEAFVGPCPPGMEGCHKDNDKTNNHASNLRWDTHFNNVQDTKLAGRTLAGERNTQAKLNPDKVREIRRMREQGLTYGEIGRSFGVSGSLAHLVVTRKVWAHV